MPAITSFDGFYAAWANPDGTMDVNSAFQIIPGPSRVDYPQTPAGVIVETADGATVQQQPNQDGRQRSWIWENYPVNASYAFWMPRLEGLRSRYRREAGLSPYVYLAESNTTLFARKEWISSTTTGAASLTTLVDTTQTFAAAAAGARIWNIQFPDSHQQGTVVNVVGDTLTLAAGGPTVAIATGERYVLQVWNITWFRCRVLEVSRMPTARGGNVRFDSTRMVFIMDDPNWNYLG